MDWLEIFSDLEGMDAPDVSEALRSSIQRRRGELVAEQSVEAPEQLAGFNCLGYRFCLEESDQTVLTFLRESRGAEK